MPKAKITKDMIIDAAFEITRSDGTENVNARTVSEKLGCSTQPVMYHFAKIEDMKRAVYEKVDSFYKEYLTDTDVLTQKTAPKENYSGHTLPEPLLRTGFNHIRFAIDEPCLYRFLFQSEFIARNSLSDVINSEEMSPVIFTLQDTMGKTMKQIKGIFLTVALFAHGYAGIIANSSTPNEVDLATVTAMLQHVYLGAVLAADKDR